MNIGIGPSAADRRESLWERGLLEGIEAENLQDCVEIELDSQLFPDDGHQDVGGDSDPDLGAHGVGGVPVERSNPQGKRLYKTTDYGNTWQRITNGIRKNDFSWVIREDPVRPGLLYAGTETGAYVSFDAGESWQSLQRNLPPAAVMFMVVKGDDLVVATHGRGFWIMDNISSLRQITPEVASASVHLFEVAPALRYLRGGRGWSSRRSLDAGQNPPRGVMIEYYLAQEASEVITITDAKGEIIQQFSSPSQEGFKPSTREGMSRFLWDIQYPGATEISAAGALAGFQAQSALLAPSPPPVRSSTSANDGN